LIQIKRMFTVPLRFNLAISNVSPPARQVTTPPRSLSIFANTL
jgi:hypothetical protein